MKIQKNSGLALVEVFPWILIGTIFLLLGIFAYVGHKENKRNVQTQQAITAKGVQVEAKAKTQSAADKEVQAAREKERDKKYRERYFVRIAEKAETVGNFSYIRLGLKELPNRNSEMILKVLSGFEESHPNLEIVGQPQIEYRTLNSSMSDITYGIWIHHRPKTTNSPPEVVPSTETEKLSKVPLKRDTLINKF